MNASLLWLWLAAVTLLQEREIVHRVLLRRADSAWLVLHCDEAAATALEKRGLGPLLRHQL